jgi:hypothetical protein
MDEAKWRALIVGAVMGFLFTKAILALFFRDKS